jgi:hypothetical protein
VSPSCQRGLVLSDLHWFARRSGAAACLAEWEAALAQAKVVVFNGDTFDFRWSTLSSPDATQRQAIDWLKELLQRYPDSQIHLVQGNHDCRTGFSEALDELAQEHDRFRGHELSLQLGSLLFLHGDCAQRRMDGPALRAYRKVWRHDLPRGRWRTVAYQAVDWLGITRLAHRWQFPRPAAVARVAYFLDRTQPGWRGEIEHCYFGHTHLPFSNYQRDGVTYHNTGSAIRGMEFNPLWFDLPAVAPSARVTAMASLNR